jgi:hypothetical protein
MPVILPTPIKIAAYVQGSRTHLTESGFPTPFAGLLTVAG